MSVECEESAHVAEGGGKGGRVVKPSTAAGTVFAH